MNTKTRPVRRTQSAWEHLNVLLQLRSREILGREMHNERLIHLYATGDYWTAFEQSACRLNRLFPDCEIAVIRLDDSLFPIVMASVAARDMADYCRGHIVRDTDSNHRILLGDRLPASQYRRWHRASVEGLL